ncbi:hypothetical protein Tcan_12249 [Toxocara canis]|uniref:Uncharacterized protein n=1 Tax=Toxocara canis TaxID=6265 RepID=A0A0B2VJV8_TOXCA|nr:hypothetical protein Tcan_12249 [Toxocara canis]
MVDLTHLHGMGVYQFRQQITDNGNIRNDEPHKTIDDVHLRTRKTVMHGIVIYRKHLKCCAAETLHPTFFDWALHTLSS